MEEEGEEKKKSKVEEDRKTKRWRKLIVITV